MFYFTLLVNKPNFKKKESSVKSNVLLSIISIYSYSVSYAHTTTYPLFFTSMNVGNRISGNSIPDPLWSLAQSCYEKNWQKKTSIKKTKYIPKIIHQIWLGSPFPEKYKKLQETWLHLHPTWEYKLWTANDIKELGLVNQAAYDSVANYGQKADIARYEILYRFGGLYIDTDFECLKSFDEIHECCDFYSGIAVSAGVLSFNGLIGSIAEHPILKRCIQNIHITGSTNPQEILGQTGPQYFTNCIKKEINSPTAGIVILFPMTYFYPWPWWERNNNSREQIMRWVQPESFAIHHWYVSWNGGKAP